MKIIKIPYKPNIIKYHKENSHRFAIYRSLSLHKTTRIKLQHAPAVKPGAKNPRSQLSSPRNFISSPQYVQPNDLQHPLRRTSPRQSPRSPLQLGRRAPLFLRKNPILSSEKADDLSYTSTHRSRSVFPRTRWK